MNLSEVEIAVAPVRHARDHDGGSRVKKLTIMLTVRVKKGSSNGSVAPECPRGQPHDRGQERPGDPQDEDRERKTAGKAVTHLQMMLRLTARPRPGPADFRTSQSAPRSRGNPAPAPARLAVQGEFERPVSPSTTISYSRSESANCQGRIRMSFAVPSARSGSGPTTSKRVVFDVHQTGLVTPGSLVTSVRRLLSHRAGPCLLRGRPAHS